MFPSTIDDLFTGLERGAKIYTDLRDEPADTKPTRNPGDKPNNPVTITENGLPVWAQITLGVSALVLAGLAIKELVD
jgi:hypothetical protein